MRARNGVCRHLVPSQPHREIKPINQYKDSTKSMLFSTYNPRGNLGKILGSEDMEGSGCRDCLSWKAVKSSHINSVGTRGGQNTEHKLPVHEVADCHSCCKLTLDLEVLPREASWTACTGSGTPGRHPSVECART